MQSLEELLVSFQSLHFTKRTSDLLEVTKRMSEQAWRKSGSCLHLCIQPRRPLLPPHPSPTPYLHHHHPPTHLPPPYPHPRPFLSCCKSRSHRDAKPLSSLTPLISLSLNGKSCRTAHSIQTLHTLALRSWVVSSADAGAACPSFHLAFP